MPSNDIEELWLSSGTISEEALIKILNHSPKLRNLNLEISIIGQSNNKLRKLNLEKLSLICCEFPNESTFKSLVTSSEKLKTFVFYQESQSDAFESKLHLLINTLRENPDVIKNLEK
ncbi:MAG: hypothetical protein HWD59_09780 [Coxiellaceae bacterium]|nr:MAG: hypothetical protein HWD59_09780 [Coxiellaceae bacterium]